MIPNTLREILDELKKLPDQDARADYLIDLASSFKEVDPKIATRPFSKSNQIPACESDAYVWVTKDPSGYPKFHFAVENPQGISAKALAVIIDQGLSGVDPKQLAQVSDEFVYEIFGSGLSMGKGIGLKSMIGMCKSLAVGLGSN